MGRTRLHASKGSAILDVFLCLVISTGVAVGQQCFVPGECSGILAGIAPENGADACLTSVHTSNTEWPIG